MIATIAPVAFLSGLIFKVVFVATWKASCGKVSDCFKRDTNHQLVAKCEQILCETAKPKFVTQSKPALNYSQQQVDQVG